MFCTWKEKELLSQMLGSEINWHRLFYAQCRSTEVKSHPVNVDDPVENCSSATPACCCPLQYPGGFSSQPSSLHTNTWISPSEGGGRYENLTKFASPRKSLQKACQWVQRWFVTLVWFRSPLAHPLSDIPSIIFSEVYHYCLLWFPLNFF